MINESMSEALISGIGGVLIPPSDLKKRMRGRHGRSEIMTWDWSMEKWMFGESQTFSSTQKNQVITMQIKQSDTHTQLSAIDYINTSLS